METDTAYLFTMVYQYNELAMIALGKITDHEGKIQPVNLETAKYAIDFLEMLERKTKGNLTEDEDRIIKQTLINLRLNYVDELKKQHTPKTAEPQPN